MTTTTITDFATSASNAAVVHQQWHHLSFRTLNKNYQLQQQDDDDEEMAADTAESLRRTSKRKRLHAFLSIGADVIVIFASAFDALKKTFPFAK